MIEVRTIFTADSGADYEILDIIHPSLQESISLDDVGQFKGDAYLFKVKSLDEHENTIRVLKKYKDSKRKETGFTQELKALSTLKNSNRSFPGVINIFDSSYRDFFIVLEHMGGGSFDKVIEQRGTGNFSNLEIFALTEIFSRPLSHMFSYEYIVHRDVKPENILLENNAFDLNNPEYNLNLENLTKEGFVKFCDFTLSLVNGRSKVHDDTKKGCFIGTPKYCSPEIMYGERGDSSSDVWALGVILYDLVSQEGFAQGATKPKEVIEYVINNQYPERIDRDLFSFEELIYKMHDRDPSERPTMSEVNRIALSFYNKFKDKENVLSP